MMISIADVQKGESMSNLIDRQEELEAVITAILDCPNSLEVGTREYRYELIKGLIEPCLLGLPAAEPERKAGRWIFTHMFTENGASSPGYECSECEEWHGTNAYRYCPDCGAYMGGDEECD